MKSKTKKSNLRHSKSVVGSRSHPETTLLPNPILTDLNAITFVLKDKELIASTYFIFTPKYLTIPLVKI